MLEQLSRHHHVSWFKPETPHGIRGRAIDTSHIEPELTRLLDARRICIEAHNLGSDRRKPSVEPSAMTLTELHSALVHEAKINDSTTSADLDQALHAIYDPRLPGNRVYGLDGLNIVRHHG